MITEESEQKHKKSSSSSTHLMQCSKTVEYTSLTHMMQVICLYITSFCDGLVLDTIFSSFGRKN